MLKSEINEVKKQFADQYCTISKIAGCYVGGEKNKITTFKEAFLSLDEGDATRYFQILRKGLSGTISKQIYTLDFPLESEFNDGAQTFLLKLRDSHLEDDDLIDEFYDKIIDLYPYPQNYLILLVDCSYDVPGKTKDGLAMEDSSNEVYHYIYCTLCPVKQSKPSLSYLPTENLFQNKLSDWVVDAPLNAFLFPAFEDRSSDLHKCLYYAKDEKSYFADFAYEMLACVLPLSSKVQKESFQSILFETLGDEASLSSIKQVHENLNEILDEVDDGDIPPTLRKEDLKIVFEKSGVSNEQLENFDECFDTAIGSDATLDIINITETKKFEVKTPDVSIKLNADCSDLIETKTIDGKTYLMIEVSNHIEVNGIPLIKPTLLE